jgi:hypothetical protein
MLTRNHRQEAISRADVQAVAARCGLSWSTPSPDYGIDLTLNDIEISGDRRIESGYKLDLQVKSTTDPFSAGQPLHYDLSTDAYDTLRAVQPGCPRLLVVLLLPADEALWITQTEDALILRHAAYWISLRGHPRTRNRRSIRIALPRAQIFSVEALQGLTSQIKAGELP